MIDLDIELTDKSKNPYISEDGPFLWSFLIDKFWLPKGSSVPHFVRDFSNYKL